MTENYLMVLALLAGLGLASVNAYSADSCEVVLCMYDKVGGGGGGGECKSAEKAFFDIVKKNKRGFLPNLTSNARKSFLLQCKSADPDAVAKIISQFGRVKG